MLWQSNYSVGEIVEIMKPSAPNKKLYGMIARVSFENDRKGII